jgi:hypothetical protein
MTETVTREIVLGTGGRLPLSVLRLSWTAADPFAVVLVVAARPEHPSLLRGRWVVLRDRFREVLAADDRSVDCPVVPGGHVQVSGGGGYLTLTLRAAPLPCVVRVPAEPVRAFLADTEAIVPPGRELWQSALDAELARMLDR